MEKLEYRYWPLDAVELRVEENEDGERSVSWYPAVFDSWSEDLGWFREKISRRAFSKTLQENDDIRALFNHNADLVLGRNKSGTLSLKVDLTGLRATVTPPDTQWARDLMVSIDRGDISAGSFGFYVLKDKWSEDEEGRLLRELQEVKLFDVSIVTYPAYPATDGTLAMRLADIPLDDLAIPMLRARAGLPLAPEQRQKFNEVIERLKGSVPEPPPSIEDENHSVKLAHKRRHLQLTEQRLRGRF